MKCGLIWARSAKHLGLVQPGRARRRVRRVRSGSPHSGRPRRRRRACRGRGRASSRRPATPSTSPPSASRGWATTRRGAHAVECRRSPAMRLSRRCVLRRRRRRRAVHIGRRRGRGPSSWPVRRTAATPVGAGEPAQERRGRRRRSRCRGRGAARGRPARRCAARRARRVRWGWRRRGGCARTRTAAATAASSSGAANAVRSRPAYHRLHTFWGG